jgi:hypothetical protein
MLLSGLTVSEAFAAPGVTIAPASDSVYVVQGSDFSGVAGVDITIRYDAAAVSGPRVVQGSLVAGALVAVNSSTPGMLRLALVRPTVINGSGTIATVTFTRLASTGADIQSIAASAISSTGSSIGMTAQVVNSVKTADSGTAANQTGGQGGTGTPTAGTSTASAGSSSAETNAGTLSPPPSNTGRSTAAGAAGSGVLIVPVPQALSDGKTTPAAPDQAAPEARQPESDKVVTQETAKALPSEHPVPPAPEPEKKRTMLYKSVLERFKEFNGVKTPEALMALFRAQEGQAKQDPPIVLSDGKTVVKVLLDLDPGGENNNFLLDGVNLVSLSNKEKNLWIAELLPDKRIYEATVSIPWKNQWHVIPLTVAPPMDVNIDRSLGKLTESHFRLFLKERGTAKAPRFDLNGDGVRDYVDDYIFTANYLAQGAGQRAPAPKFQTKTIR